MTPTTPTPFWTPLLRLFSSRAFLLALGTAIIDALIVTVPSLEPLRGDLMNTLTVLVGLIVAKMTVEDVNQVHSAAKVEVARHQANAAIASAQITANPEVSDGDTQPLSPPLSPYRGNQLNR